MSDRDKRRYDEVKADPVRYAEYLERKRLERKRRGTDSDYETQRKRNWRAANRDKAKAMAAAHFAVETAIERGELVRPETCSRCGTGGKIEGHHSSYAPGDRLKVDWLCVMCHAAEHRKTCSSVSTAVNLERKRRVTNPMTTKPPTRIVNLHDQLSDDLARMTAYFKDPAMVKITLVIRLLGLADGDVVIGDDDYDLAIAAINHLRAKATHVIEPRDYKTRHPEAGE